MGAAAGASQPPCEEGERRRSAGGIFSHSLPLPGPRHDPCTRSCLLGRETGQVRARASSVGPRRGPLVGSIRGPLPHFKVSLDMENSRQSVKFPRTSASRAEKTPLDARGGAWGVQDLTLGVEVVSLSQQTCLARILPSQTLFSFRKKQAKRGEGVPGWPAPLCLCTYSTRRVERGRTDPKGPQPHGMHAESMQTMCCWRFYQFILVYSYH